MRHFLVQNGQIVGITDTCDNAPGGFECFHYEGDEPMESLYYNGSVITPKPMRPEEGEWYWDGSQWVEVPVIMPPQDVVTLPTGEVSQDELLSHPLFKAMMTHCTTDQVLLTKVLTLVITFLFDRNAAKALLSQTVREYNEQYGTAEGSPDSDGSGDTQGLELTGMVDVRQSSAR